MNYVNIKEENVLRAYKNGCEDVKGVLWELFPDIIKKLNDDYRPEDIKVCIKRNVSGDYFEIDAGGPFVRNSRAECIINGDAVLVPFSTKFMEVTHGGNFRLKV